MRAECILETLDETDSASREEWQEATGASRNSVTNALGDLITIGPWKPLPRLAALTGVTGAPGHSLSGLAPTLSKSLSTSDRSRL
jgi:hypothetical protein